MPYAMQVNGNASDDLTVLAGGSLTVNGALLNSGGGDIILAAQGSTASDDLTINADIEASGTNGAINLFAGHDVLHNSGLISTAGTGAITISAGMDYNGGANQATVNITITPINNPPVITDQTPDPLTTPEETPLNITLANVRRATPWLAGRKSPLTMMVSAIARPATRRPRLNSITRASVPIAM